MTGSAERYLPQMSEPYITYEHWHRYLFATRFVAGKAVLDIACGEGYGSRLLADVAATVVAVDLDPETVRAAAASYVKKNLSFRCGRAEEIPVEGRAVFDVIVSFEMLEHLTADGQLRFAAEVKRLLVPDGLLLISTPNRLVYTERNQHHNPFHLREFTREEFLAFLAGQFAHVQLLSQRVYPGSYIWNIDRPMQRCTEHQVAFVDGRCQPAAGDGKEQLYFLAVCSDRPQPPVENSLLLDLDETAIRGTPAPQGHEATLYVDTGDGFRPEQVCSQRLGDRPSEFVLSYSLGHFGAVRALRWDPVEQRLCRLRLRGVTWEDEAGQVQDVDLACISTNGVWLEDWSWRFDTVDPMVFLPVAGRVARLTVRGSCYVETSAASLLRLDALYRETRADLPRQEGSTTTLFVDTGEGFRAEQAFSLPVGEDANGEFALTFSLPAIPPVQALRWDPVEGRLCSLQLAEVRWEDGFGVAHSLDLRSIRANGLRAATGQLDFETLDPMVFLPISGEVRSLSVRGRWEVDPAWKSLCKLEALLNESRRQLTAREQQLQELREGLQAPATISSRAVKQSSRRSSGG